MPKMKTHKGTAKRVKTTATGKVLRRRAATNHLLAKKSASSKRASNTTASITGKLAKNVKRALGA